LDFINEYFQFIDGNRLFTAFELLEVMNSVKNEWNYTGALIDPYNSLSTDQKKLGKTGMHEYHYEVASALRVFAHQNNVTTIVNAHPVTEAMRKTFTQRATYAGMAMPPNTADIEGGGKWGNRSDCCVVIHRSQLTKPIGYTRTSTFVRSRRWSREGASRPLKHRLFYRAY
jgi:hypothetical protein